MLRTEFRVALKKFSFYIDKSIDWFIKSFKFDRTSYEYQICLLKSKMYQREAVKMLITCNSELECGGELKNYD